MNKLFANSLWIERTLTALALGGAAFYIGTFLYLALSRICYPFALEWLEGGSYLQVHRVLTGQPLYERPSMDYVAMLYPPFYYYLSAALSRIIGEGLLPLRLVSFLSSLGCMVVIYLICKQEGCRHFFSLLAGGLFAATYSLTGYWFDVGRVDMLSVFLVLGSLCLLFQRRLWANVAAGMGFALACLTKQTHLVTLVCISLYLSFTQGRKSLPFLLTALATLASVFVFLDRLYDGWFKFFVLNLALGSGEYVSFSSASALHTALDFWIHSIILALPVVTILILVHVVLTLKKSGNAGRTPFFLAAAVGMIGTSWSVVQVGGYNNDLVPAYAILSILFGLSLQAAAVRLASNPIIRNGILIAVIFQFAMLVYPIAGQIPSESDLNAGRALVSEIQQQEGMVYIPFHPELALMAGKSPFASWSPMYQLEGNYGGGDTRLAARVKTEFSHALQHHDFSMIILDQDPNWIWGDPGQYYSSSEPVFNDPDVFWPVTGWHTRPRIMMLPKGDG